MTEQKTKFEQIWGEDIAKQGLVQTPRLLIRLRRKLKIEHGEMTFLMTLLSYKHDSRDPYPSRETLAEFMDVSERQIDKWSGGLRKKCLLLVYKDGTKTKYNIQPLINRLKEMCGAVEPEVQHSANEPVELPVQVADNLAVPQVQAAEIPRPEVQEPFVPEGRTEYSIESFKDPHTNSYIKLESDESIQVTESDMSLWGYVKEAIRPRFSPPTFETWFDNLFAVVRDGVVTISSSMPFVSNWVEAHYKDLLLNTFAQYHDNVSEIHVRTA